MKVKLEKRRAR